MFYQKGPSFFFTKMKPSHIILNHLSHVTHLKTQDFKAHGDHLGDLNGESDVGADDVPHGLQGDWLLFLL